MTDEQINQRIAEACGWKCAGHPDQLKATEGWEFGYQFVLQPDGQLVTHNSIPNYCTNLNAMHDALMTLKDYSMRKYYTQMLEAVVDEPLRFYAIASTARQRAEAFLRTLGKWEEVQG